MSDRMRKIGVVVSILVVLMVSPSGVDSLPVFTATEGGYVDQVIYKRYSSPEQALYALVHLDEIDLLWASVGSQFLDTTEGVDDIAVESVSGSHQSILTINCDKYPLNVTAFRRAIAIALDKSYVAQQDIDGAVPHDSLLPGTSPWCAEDELSYNYYESDIAEANQLLDDAGFLDSDMDGTREAPDSSEFDVTVEMAYWTSSPLPSYYEALKEGLESALSALTIDHTVLYTDFMDTYSTVVLHGDFDMAVMGRDLAPVIDIRGTAEFYTTLYADIDYYNTARFRNASYDQWYASLCEAQDVTEVKASAKKLQEILVEECPFIVCWSETENYAYRTDRFTDLHVPLFENEHFPWSQYLTRLNTAEGGPFGGTLRIGVVEDMETFNFFLADEVYDRSILSHVKLPLLNTDTSHNHIPWLAESFSVEALEDGQVQYIFTIRDGVAWPTGEPVTAEDVAYSFIYMAQSDALLLAVRDDIEVLSVETISPSSVVIVVGESDTVGPSYWQLGWFAQPTIYPDGFFEDTTSWQIWEPVTSDDPFVTAGAFTLEDYVENDYMTFAVDTDFLVAVSRVTPTPTTSTTTESTGTTTQPNGLPVDETMLIAIGVIGAGVVLMVVVLVIRRR